MWQQSDNKDPDGERIVGVTFQFEVQIGGVSTGVKVVIYFDKKVCGEADYLVAMYTYAGSEITIDDLSDVMSIADVAALSESISLSYYCHEARFEKFFLTTEMTQVFRSAFKEGGNISIACAIIDGNDDFISIVSYEGLFETRTISGTFGNKTGSLFWSYSSTCNTYGVKYSWNTPAPMFFPISFGYSYSRTYYSNASVLFEGYL